MDHDSIAIAFANWMQVHRAHVEAERRLAIASRTAWHMGMQPPQELVAEVAALKAESRRLLAIAEAEMRRKSPAS